MRPAATPSSATTSHGMTRLKPRGNGYTDWETGAKIDTNTVEGYYSTFQRGMIGIYQHGGEQHLHRYLAELDFRYSNRVKLGIDHGTRAERRVAWHQGQAVDL